MNHTMLVARALSAAALLWSPIAWAQAQTTPVPVPSLPPTWPYGPGHMWGWGPGHMWSDGSGWPMFWGGPFMMVLVILAFVWVMRLLFGHARWRDEFHYGGRHKLDRMDIYPNRSALRILNERFARGEIQKEEYDDRKAALLGDGAR